MKNIGLSLGARGSRRGKISLGATLLLLVGVCVMAVPYPRPCGSCMTGVGDLGSCALPKNAGSEQADTPSCCSASVGDLALNADQPASCCSVASSSEAPTCCQGDAGQACCGQCSSVETSQTASDEASDQAKCCQSCACGVEPKREPLAPPAKAPVSEQSTQQLSRPALDHETPAVPAESSSATSASASEDVHALLDLSSSQRLCVWRL